MDQINYNFNMEDQKPIFTTATETTATTTTESFITTGTDTRNMTTTEQSGMFSATIPPYQRSGGTELLSMLTPQEPLPADPAPPGNTDMDDILLNIRMNSSEMLFDELEHGNPNYYLGGTRPESVASSNIWNDATMPNANARNGEMMDTFDFLIKSLSSANNYVSMLTREQLSVLRSIRPSLLYEFLQEVAKVRSDRRMRRALPNECAFCKNNGENEECYSSHALKDWRGRVLCPVLRAFRCPRCGATGDRAHTIKYCPENADTVSERSGSLSARRRVPPSASLVMGGATNRPNYGPLTPTAPAPSPVPTGNSYSSSFWTSFSIN